MTAVCLLASVSVAQAKPSFGLAESSARAGDVLHFSLSGADGSSYVVDLDGTRIASGVASGVVTGAFTVPTLGGQEWTVPVTATIRTSGSRTAIRASFDYLGRALPPPPPPEPSPPPPAGPPQPQTSAPAPGPAASPTTVTHAAPAPAVAPQPRRSHGTPRKSPAEDKRPKSHRPGHKHHAKRGHRGGHRAKTGSARRKRSHHRRTEWPLGSLEAGRSAPGSASDPAPEKPTASRPAVTVAAHPHVGGSSTAAVVLPALLGLAGMALAATAVLRRRRLASRRPRD